MRLSLRRQEAESARELARESHWAHFSQLLQRSDTNAALRYFEQNGDIDTDSVDSLRRAFCSARGRSMDERLLRMMRERGKASDGDVLSAAAKCSRAAVQSVLDSGVRVDALSSDGRNALMSGEDVGALTLLVERGLAVDARSAGGITALMLHRTPQVTSFLLEHHADPKAVDSAGRTPLHFGMPGSCIPDCVGLLVHAGVNPNQRDRTSKGNTPLSLLAYEERIADDVPAGWSQALADALVENGADPTSADGTGKTPLEILLDDGLPFDKCLRWPTLHLDGPNGSGLLIKAMEKNRTGTVVDLVEAGANPFIPNAEGVVPIELYRKDTPPKGRLTWGKFPILERTALRLEQGDASL